MEGGRKKEEAQATIDGGKIKNHDDQITQVQTTQIGQAKTKTNQKANKH